MDTYNVGVDPTILRSILLRKRLKRFPKVLNRSPISKNNVALNRKQVTKVPKAFRKPLRNTALRKPEIPTELENELVTSAFPQYCWEISTTKRRKNMILQNELGEKNPYSHPVEGVRHNLRNLLDPVNKCIMKKRLDLPVDKKYTHKVRRQLKAKAIVNNLYKATEPEEVFEEKLQSIPKHLETSTPLEYRITWKEIELCKIMHKLKTVEVDNINNEMQQKEAAINRKKNILREEASSMENTISENEKILYDELRQLVMEKDVTRQKVQKTEELADQIGLLKHQIHFILSRIGELHKYGKFLFGMSPYDWQAEQNKLHDLTGNEIFTYEGDVLDDLDYLHDLVNKISKPVLYFKSPEEFTGLFTELEDVNFVVYSHSKVITNLAEAGMSYASELTKRYSLELDILKEMSHELSKDIQWEENHIQLLKEFCSKYIFTDFATLVYELENVKLAVENTYVDVLTTNDLDLGPATLMKEIELLVVNLTESANPSNPETIKLTKQMNHESRLREIAQRKFEKTFREYELLLKELRRSFEYEKRSPRRKLMPRSPVNVRHVESQREEVKRHARDENFKYFGDDAFPCRSFQTELP